MKVLNARRYRVKCLLIDKRLPSCTYLLTYSLDIRERSRWIEKKMNTECPKLPYTATSFAGHRLFLQTLATEGRTTGADSPCLAGQLDL